MRYELMPNTSQKSFYGKAIVDEQGDTRTLYSYGTKILTISNTGEIVRHWDGWTATTGKHIAAFCGMNKKSFTALPVTR